MESGVNPHRYPGCHTAVRRTSIALSTPATPGYTVADALQLESTSAPSQIDYLHPDHLGTVRAITDTNQTVVWRWDSTPFGDTLPNEDPDGDGQALRFNLRFPGQYFDVETGLHYNYFRDYDSSTGRYVQSDPIGLRGGINTYIYGINNPIRYTDPTGQAVALGIPLIIKVCEWTAAAMIGIMGGVAIVEKIDCDNCEKEEDENDQCKKAIFDARRIYNDLVSKRIPQYLSGGTRGSDPTHYNTILQRQVALRKAINRVRLYCKNPPAEILEWERIANFEVPVLH